MYRWRSRHLGRGSAPNPLHRKGPHTWLSTSVNTGNLDRGRRASHGSRVGNLDLGTVDEELGVDFIREDVLEAQQIISWRCSCRDGEVGLHWYQRNYQPVESSSSYSVQQICAPEGPEHVASWPPLSTGPVP